MPVVGIAIAVCEYVYCSDAHQYACPSVSQELGSFGLMFYNSLFSLPFLLFFLAFHMDEVEKVCLP